MTRNRLATYKASTRIMRLDVYLPKPCVFVRNIPMTVRLKTIDTPVIAGAISHLVGYQGNYVARA